MDTYRWGGGRWGAEKIIGFDVHLDETTPHIHIQTIPIAKTKARGRASVKYVHKSDKSRILSQKEWKKLPEEIRCDFTRTEVERRERECVSYARVWGEDKYAVGKTYYQMHTDYHDEVGWKYGLERGDDIAMLPQEEQRERVHKNKAVLEAERRVKDAVINAKAENEQLRQQKDRIEQETKEAEQRKQSAEGKLAGLEEYAKASDIKEEDLIIPQLNTNPLVRKAVEAILEELDKPIPIWGGQKEWREERKTAVREILTDLQTELMQAKEMQKQDILRLGKSLYQQARKNIHTIIEENKQLRKANERLTVENNGLKEKISTMDDTAISNLHKQKDEEIKALQIECNRANAHATKSDNMATREHQRAENAESQIQAMMAIPEIKEMWEGIQRNMKVFWRQINKWIEEGVAAIRDYAEGKDNDYQPKAGNVVAWGIIAKAFECGLNPTDEKQRRVATAYLLEKVSWTGISSEFKIDLTATRTRQLSDAMTVPKDLMANLLLAAGGRGGISTGGGGSNSELTNWDGTKKRNGWGR